MHAAQAGSLPDTIDRALGFWAHASLSVSLLTSNHNWKGQYGSALSQLQTDIAGTDAKRIQVWKELKAHLLCEDAGTFDQFMQCVAGQAQCSKKMQVFLKSITDKDWKMGRDHMHISDEQLQYVEDYTRIVNRLAGYDADDEKHAYGSVVASEGEHTEMVTHLLNTCKFPAEKATYPKDMRFSDIESYYKLLNNSEKRSKLEEYYKFHTDFYSKKADIEKIDEYKAELQVWRNADYAGQITELETNLEQAKKEKDDFKNRLTSLEAKNYPEEIQQLGQQLKEAQGKIEKLQQEHAKKPDSPPAPDADKGGKPSEDDFLDADQEFLEGEGDEQGGDGADPDEVLPEGEGAEQGGGGADVPEAPLDEQPDPFPAGAEEGPIAVKEAIGQLKEMQQQLLNSDLQGTKKIAAEMLQLAKRITSEKKVENILEVLIYNLKSTQKATKELAVTMQKNKIKNNLQTLERNANQ